MAKKQAAAKKVEEPKEDLKQLVDELSSVVSQLNDSNTTIVGEIKNLREELARIKLENEQTKQIVTDFGKQIVEQKKTFEHPEDVEYDGDKLSFMRCLEIVITANIQANSRQFTLDNQRDHLLNNSIKGAKELFDKLHAEFSH